MQPQSNQKDPNTSPRRLNRIAAVQAIYMAEANTQEAIQDTLDLFFMNQDEPRSFYKFAETLIRGTLVHLQEIDKTIKKYAQNWALDRIAKTDLAILRLAIYELFFRNDIPPIVSINEAIELTKILSNDESKRFVNGILDKVKSDLKRPLREASK